VLVAGQFGMQNWLARITRDGNVVWERLFGFGKAASVAVYGDLIVVAAFDADNIERPQLIENERISVWRFDMSGQLIDQHVVIQNIGNIYNYSNMHNTFIEVIPDPSGRSFYLFAAWSTKLKPATPLEVVKLSAQADVLWRTKLPDTVYKAEILEEKGGPVVGEEDVLCRPRMTVLSTGVPVIIVCGSERAFALAQLLPTSGEIRRTLVQPPHPSGCDPGFHQRDQFVTQGKDSRVLLFGTGGACGWLGQVVLPEFVK